jgi:hypothetical protein
VDTSKKKSQTKEIEMKRLILVLGMVLAFAACKRGHKETRNFACEFAQAQDADAKCKAQYTDVGETHAHSAIVTMPNKTVWKVKEDVSNIREFACIAGPCPQQPGQPPAGPPPGSQQPTAIVGPPEPTPAPAAGSGSAK